MQNVNFAASLRHCRLFDRLSDTEIKAALDLLHTSLRHYEKGEFLHMADAPLEKFGMVLEGSVGVFIDDPDGNRMLMAQVGAGQTFGEAICFLRAENPAIYAIANETCLLLWLSPQELFTAAPSPLCRRLEQNFTAMMAERTLAMNDRIQTLSKLTLRDKILTYFTFLSKRSGKRHFSVPFDREDMAAYIGVNRSALSRELSKMKQEGIIDFQKNTFWLK